MTSTYLRQVRPSLKLEKLGVSELERGSDFHETRETNLSPPPTLNVFPVGYPRDLREDRGLPKETSTCEGGGSSFSEDRSGSREVLNMVNQICS